MKYIEYLDLPPIPENLLESVTDIINKPQSWNDAIPADYPFFKNRNVNDELVEWLQSIFEFKIYAQYQLIYDGLPIHIDRGNRITAYNYLLDTGGSKVKTSIYDKNYMPLQVEQLELKRWHKINTSMLHGVSGIETVRVSVTVTRVIL